MQERFPMSDDEAEEDEDGHDGDLEQDAAGREVEQREGEEVDKDGRAAASSSRGAGERQNQTESMEVDVSPAASEKSELKAQSRKHSRVSRAYFFNNTSQRLCETRLNRS